MAQKIKKRREEKMGKPLKYNANLVEKNNLLSEDDLRRLKTLAEKMANGEVAGREIGDVYPESRPEKK